MSVAKAKEIRAEDFSPYRIAEFFSNFKLTPTGCMEYLGSERVKGYGCIEMHGRTARSHRRCLAHRAAYALTWGVCPAGKVVRHKCDNPKCINPVHLELGTQKDNSRDMITRGRHWRQRQAK